MGSKYEITEDGAELREFVNGEGAAAMAEGDVVVISSTVDFEVLLSSANAQTAVVGVVVKGGNSGEIVKVCIAGMTSVKVASAVTSGDSLQTSTTIGKAKKTAAPAVNAVLGKALQTIGGAGTIKAIINLA